MTTSDWDVVREAIAKVEPPSDIIACGCIGLNDEQGRCRCEQDYPAGWALHRLQAENERLREALQSIVYEYGLWADGADDGEFQLWNLPRLCEAIVSARAALQPKEEA